MAETNENFIYIAGSRFVNSLGFMVEILGCNEQHDFVLLCEL